MSDSLRRFEVAERLFPLQWRFRSGGAYFRTSVVGAGSRDEIKAEIRRALATNPFLLDLRRSLAGYLWEEGRQDEAVAELWFIRHIAPNAKIEIRVAMPAPAGALPEAPARP
jgi:hypothetical protein